MLAVEGPQRQRRSCTLEHVNMTQMAAEAV